jgi:large subunit ribosomal protein L25
MVKGFTITAESRDSRGKNEARRLRAQGSVPAILYGGPAGPAPVAVSPKELTKVLNSKTGHNTIFNLSVAGKEDTPVMIVDWQYEPIKGSLLHIDVKRIAMDEKLRVRVPVLLKGEAAGVKQQGGILEQVVREVELECLPGDIPTHIEADVSELVFGKVLRVGDLPHSEALQFITDENQVIAHITVVKEVVEPTPAEAAAPTEAAPAEPEVIKKGKQETAEEGEEPAKKAEKGEKK